MVLDIIKYGDTNYGKLRTKNVDVKKENPFLHQLINNTRTSKVIHNMDHTHTVHSI